LEDEDEDGICLFSSSSSTVISKSRRLEEGVKLLTWKRARSQGLLVSGLMKALCTIGMISVLLLLPGM